MTDAEFDDEGVRATLVTPQGEHHVRSTLLGRFNLSNVLGIDLSAASVAKIAKNALKYPADQSRGRWTK